MVGDVDGNVCQVLDAARRAQDELGAQWVAFPELTLTGYPPEDLLLRPDFIAQVQQGLARLLREAPPDLGLLIGFPERVGGALYNAAALIHGGQRQATYHKCLLPNYGVFDERRYFTPGTAPCVVEFRGLRIGLTICEDIWQPEPVHYAAAAGAQLLININASPFHAGKGCEREAVAAARARETGLPLAYVNLVGGQDELVFDGGSFALDANGVVCTRAPAFTAGLYPVDIEIGAHPRVLPGSITAPPEAIASVYHALVLGVRDYLRKNRFPGALVGLSGGIDSALTLCIAVDALGAERVTAVMMPSRYNAAISLEDAVTLADALGVAHHIIPIETLFQGFLTALAPAFHALPADTTEENLQARCRGVLLMALSNKTRRIVLTTGNKSEMAMGYATLYGDMAGGFAPLKDVPKTLVYALAEYRNAHAAVIPRRIIERAPSAELAPHQTDQDSLPPYAVLDAILECYVEHDQSPEQIVAAGFDAAVVRDVTRRVDGNEYKRRQAPPGVRVSARAFGRDRRYPITRGV